jgi:hypothetical protein
VNGAMIGMLLIALSVAMLVSALPRGGQVVGFLRNRDWLEASYVVAIASLFMRGVIVTPWRRGLKPCPGANR